MYHEIKGKKSIVSTTADCEVREMGHIDQAIMDGEKANEPSKEMQESHNTSDKEDFALAQIALAKALAEKNQ